MSIALSDILHICHLPYMAAALASGLLLNITLRVVRDGFKIIDVDGLLSSTHPHTYPVDHRR